MKKFGVIDWIALILVIIGALNWGLVGFFEWDLVKAIFGGDSIITRVIYDVVGVAGLYMIAISPKFTAKAE